MFPAHLGEEVSSRATAPGFYIFMTPADTFHGVLKILAFPIQIDSQSFIECDGRVWPCRWAYSSNCALRSGLREIASISQA